MGDYIVVNFFMFPISRDPPEGGTTDTGELYLSSISSFQFLGIPPKGELYPCKGRFGMHYLFPISRDPPEGGTSWVFFLLHKGRFVVSNF